MTILEAIRGEKERRKGEPGQADNSSAQMAVLGTDLAALGGSQLLTKGLFDSGVQVPMRSKTTPSMMDLALRAGLEIEPETHASFYENAYFKPRRLFPWSKGLFPWSEGGAGLHGSIGRTGQVPDWIPVDIAAHEIGHGQSWYGKAGRLPQLIARSRVPSQLGAGAASLIGLLKGTTGQRSLEEREKWLNLASIGGGVGMVPVLADEAIASRNALKLLRGLPHQVFEKEIAQQAVKRLSRAFGTYGLGALGLVLGPQLAKRYYQKQNE